MRRFEDFGFALHQDFALCYLHLEYLHFGLGHLQHFELDFDFLLMNFLDFPTAIKLEVRQVFLDILRATYHLSIYLESL